MNGKKNTLIVTLIGLSIVFGACNKKEADFDASGAFEAKEIIVSAEATGEIISFPLDEGADLLMGQQIAVIDSTQLSLKLKQLLLTQKALLTRKPDTEKQIAVIQQQLKASKAEKNRIQNLVNAQVANEKQLDDIQSQIELLEKQLAAQSSNLQNTTTGVEYEAEGLSIQIEQTKDQLKKCTVTSPYNGTIIAKYAEQGEIVGFSKPLLKIANTKHFILRVYVTGDQLSQIKLNQNVKVFADFGEELKEYQGKINWISSKSEFTPKTIQTKDERADLVYAVKINVENDGYLKIGQYGSVKFNSK